MEPFERLVERHGDLVWRVCRAVLDPVHADDAWSETFLAALRAYESLPAGSDTKAWLVVIAHRKALDIHRARARLPTPTELLPDRPGVHDTRSVVAIDDQVARHELLMTALARLPLGQRQAVVYHHLVGLPHREVADLVGISHDAARRAASDGMAALRRLVVDSGTGAAPPRRRPPPPRSTRHDAPQGRS
ncbi:RNA polymerase sigma factor [Frigoribacterium sp. 2-23]|uniref:RNA polymerase sigma factor n=1 Tax=Frigoribacterium sp. 2-23 TaxID=3415006 RepID=UPI003C706063